MGMELPAPWFLLRHTLSDYVRLQPGRPIIVSYGAHWGAGTESHWILLFDAEVRKLLTDSGLLCLIGDRTMEGGPDARDSHFGGTVPVTAIFDPEAGNWIVLPHILTHSSVEVAVANLTRNQENTAEDSTTLEPRLR
ncbi:hypothetical protein BH23VER1_BH23VER1_13650 [soil metagenome]